MTRVCVSIRFGMLFTVDVSSLSTNPCLHFSSLRIESFPRAYRTSTFPNNLKASLTCSTGRQKDRARSVPELNDSRRVLPELQQRRQTVARSSKKPSSKNDVIFPFLLKVAIFRSKGTSERGFILNYSACFYENTSVHSGDIVTIASQGTRAHLEAEPRKHRRRVDRLIRLEQPFIIAMEGYVGGIEGMNPRT